MSQLTEFKRYFENTAWLIAERSLRLIVTFLVVGYMARYLGPADYGLLNYTISFVTLFSALATLGLDGIVIRKLVRDQTKKDSCLGTAFWLKAAGAALAILCVFVTLQFTSHDRYTNILILIISSGLLLQSFNVIDFYFQSQVLSRYVATVQIAQLIIASLLRLYLIFIQAPLLHFAVVTVFENLILAAGLVIIYLKQKYSIKIWRFDPALAKDLLKNSLPLIFSGLAVSIYMRVDQVMIKAMLDNEAVGHYAAAVSICEAWYFIPVVVTGSLFPAIMEAKKKEGLYYHRLQRLFDLVVVLSFVAVIITLLTGKMIISLIFGTEYLTSLNVIYIYIWTSFFVSLGVASEKWLLAENLQIYSFYRTLTGAALNIALNFILIPQWGIQGAALATLVSQCFSAYLSLIFIKGGRAIFISQTKALNFPFALGRVIGDVKTSL